jgi:RNA-directed DNA polymerase
MTKTTKITNCVSGVLSPLLSNIMLDEMDKELESRGHSFVRYADDGAPRMLLSG